MPDAPRPGRPRRLFQLRRGRGWDERAVDLELEHHLALRIEELIEEGFAPDEARRRAEEAFGDRARYRRACVAEQRRGARMTWWKQLVAGAAMDVRYAMRQMRNAPAFALSVVVTLAIGIGANAAIFTVIDALILEPIPFAEPDELHTLAQVLDRGGFTLYFFDPEAALHWRDDAEIDAAVALLADVEMLYTDGSEPRTLEAEAVSPGITSLIGIAPWMGRGLTAEDGAPGATPVAVVSYSFWASELGRNPNVLGSTVRVDDIATTVVGVLPEDFRSPSANVTDLWVPLSDDGTVRGVAPTWVNVYLRVHEDANERVTAQIEAFARAMPELGEAEDGWVPRLVPLNVPGVEGTTKTALWVVFGAVALMLLIAMVNGVNLVLARATTRARELGVRLAIGGGRARIAGQIVTESLVLAVLSGLAAVALAAAGVDLLVSLAPESLRGFTGRVIDVDRRVLLFVAGLSGVSGLALGLLPALNVVRVGRTIVGAGLGVRDGATRRWHRMRGALVVSQVALSLVLLFGAGLLVRSFLHLVSVDPGLDPDGLVTLMIQPPEARYSDAASRAEYVTRLRSALAATPGVEAVSLSSGVPPSTGVTFGIDLFGEDPAEPVVEGDVILPFTTADPDYLRVTRIELLAGRDLAAADAGTRNVLATRSLAEKLAPGGSAVGTSFHIEDGDPWRIVGVVEDVKLSGPESRFGDAGFISPAEPAFWSTSATFAIRLSGDEAAAMTAVRETVHGVEPAQPIGRLETIEEAFASSVARPRFFMVLMGIFAGLALALAGIGLYGVLAFAVGQRIREMGIRIALGGSVTSVRRLVLGGGLRLAVLGVGMGAGVALGASRVLEELLFEVSATDALTLVAAATAMLAVAGLASWLPAVRATTVNPVEVLKAE